MLSWDTECEEEGAPGCSEPRMAPPDIRGEMEWTTTRPCRLTFQVSNKVRGGDDPKGKAGSIIIWPCHFGMGGLCGVYS